MKQAGRFANAVLLLSIASIAMICSTKMAAQMTERTLNCTPTPDSNRIKCETIYQPAVSGGGNWFGPYWDAVSMTPDGYKIESASLEVGGPGAPRRCIVDLNSPVVPVDAEEARLRAEQHVAWLPGNHDSQNKGHQNGNGGADAVCYIAERTDQRVYFRYAIRGIPAHSTSGTDKIPGVGTFPKWSYVSDQQVAEGAQLTAVFVKIAPPAPVWPQAHKVVKGESLTLIAKATYGKPNWWKIYAANKGKIGDADEIFPGEDLTLPAP